MKTVFRAGQSRVIVKKSLRHAFFIEGVDDEFDVLVDTCEKLFALI
jgi:hypothetical protein